jgi:hypothetical protein
LCAARLRAGLAPLIRWNQIKQLTNVPKNLAVIIDRHNINLLKRLGVEDVAKLSKKQMDYIQLRGLVHRCEVCARCITQAAP